MKTLLILLISILAISANAKQKNRINQILLSGNGQSFETAYIVYNVEEEYSTMQHLQKKPSSQALVTFKKELYDVFIDAKTGKNIYFKIVQQQQPKKEDLCL
jgi:hypothetical protein